MGKISPETALLVMWVGFLVVGLVGAFAALYWAIRNRQFSNQDRARQLPLDSGIPEEKPADPEQEPHKHR